MMKIWRRGRQTIDTWAGALEISRLGNRCSPKFPPILLPPPRLFFHSSASFFSPQNANPKPERQTNRIPSLHLAHPPRSGGPRPRRHRASSRAPPPVAGSPTTPASPARPLPPRRTIPVRSKASYYCFLLLCSRVRLS
jgi:hypothetical protein